VAGFLDYWYYFVPDYALAVVMYTILGRMALSLFLEPDSPNYIWRFFCRVSDPAVALFARVTPKATAQIVLWGFSFVWLFWLRFALRTLYTAAGLLPPM
jgi:YggT family protein